MPATPYWHVAAQPFGLSSNLDFVFTLRPNSVAVVKRRAERATGFMDGYYEGTWELPWTDGVDTMLYPIEGTSPQQYRWRRIVGRSWQTWVPPTWNTTMVDYYVSLGGIGNIQPGDTVHFAYGTWDIHRASASGPTVTRIKTEDLPALPEGLGYGTELGFTFSFGNSVVSSDFAPLTPVSAEPKGLSGAGASREDIARTLWTSLRVSDPPYVTDATDTPDNGALRSFPASEYYSYLIAPDGTIRVFNRKDLGTDPADADIAAYVNGVTGGSGFTVSQIPTGEGETAYDLESYKIVHAGNKGTAVYGQGVMNVSLGLAAQSYNLLQPDPAFGTAAWAYQYVEWTGVEGSSPPAYNPFFTWHQPRPEKQWTEVYPAIPGGPNPGVTSVTQGWQVTIPVDSAPPPDERSRHGISHLYPASWASPVASFSKHVSTSTNAVLWQFWKVSEDGGIVIPPDGETETYKVFGMTMDWTVFHLTRLIHNFPPGTAVLTLTLSDDQEATWTSRDLGFNGQGPSLLCTDDGAMLLATSGVTLTRSYDEGNEWTPMPSPGPGYYPCMYEARGDVFSPLFCAVSTVSKDNGALVLYRSWDRGATWDSVTVMRDGVAISVPAQRVSLCGSISELLLAYHSGAVHVLKSTDCGATWEEV